MGGWVVRWFRVTLRLNPVLPLSALALLAGTYLLTQGRGLGSGVGQTLLGVAILEGFELCLLGTAAFVLWPRRIGYETVTILVMRGVLRFAPPLLVIGLSADGHVLAAFRIGVGLVGLAALKAELANRRLDLGLKLGARLYDLALYASVVLLLPLLADRLPVWTGDLLTHEGARVAQLAAWWAGALALLPLALGVDGLGAGGAQRRFRHTVAGRCVTFVCFVGLVFNALWLGGTPPIGLDLVPALLIGLAFAARLAPRGALPRCLVHAPAALVALSVLAPAELLVGSPSVASRVVGCLAVSSLALGAVPLITTRHWRAGMRSLSVVLSLAPLRFVGGFPEAEGYLSAVAATVLALGLFRRSDRWTALGASALAVFGGHLVWTVSHGLQVPVAVFSVFGAGLAVAVGRRLPAGSSAGRVSAAVCIGVPVFALVNSVPGVEVGAELCATAALAWLGWKQRRPALPWIAGTLSLALVGRMVSALVEPGVSLVLLAFAGIPLGTGLAVHRERRARAEGRGGSERGEASRGLSSEELEEPQVSQGQARGPLPLAEALGASS